MSHPVTISTPYTITSNAISLNLNYLRTIPGILKLGELVLGIVTVGCIAPSYDSSSGDCVTIFALLMATTFMMCTFCMLLACVITRRNTRLISETMFELIYHTVATSFLLAASITLAIDYNPYYYDQNTAASTIGSINTGLYFLSTVFAYKGLVDVPTGYYNANADFDSKLKRSNGDFTRY